MRRKKEGSHREAGAFSSGESGLSPPSWSTAAGAPRALGRPSVLPLIKAWVETGRRGSPVSPPAPAAPRSPRARQRRAWAAHTWGQTQAAPRPT